MPTPIPGVATARGEGPGGRVGGATGLILEESPIHSPTHSPPWWGLETSEDEEAELPFLEFDLEPPPELGPDVDHFLQELASKSREDGEHDSSPEPPAEEYEKWVEWRGHGQLICLAGGRSWWGFWK